MRRGQIAELLSKEHRKTTLILWFIWFANAFSYYGIVLLTTEMFQIGSPCKGKLNNLFLSFAKDFNYLFLIKATEANRQNIEPFCYLRCLQSQDYIDLLYTTIAEFPGMTK